MFKKEIQTSINKLNFSYIIIFIYFIICTYFFLEVEPRIDQARHISWIIFLKNVDHIINFKNIYNDHHGLIYELFRYANKDVGHILNIFPIIVISLVSKLLDTNTLQIFNFISILFHTLSVWLIYEILSKYKNINKNWNCLYLIYFISTPFFFYFAPLGIHNISLFFFLKITEYCLKKEFRKKDWYYFGATLLIASFTHKINCLIIYPTLILYYYFFRSKKDFIIISLILLIISLPILFLFFLSANTLNDNVNYANLELNNIGYYINNIKYASSNIYKLLLPHNFIIISILFFLVKKLKLKNFLFILIIFQIFFFISINGYASNYTRTFLYLFASIFLFVFINSNNQVNKYILNLIKLLTFLGFILNCYYIYKGNKNNAFKKTDFFQTYYQDQKKIKKFFEKDFSQYVSAKIIFYSNLSEDYYLIFNEKNFKKNRILNKPILNVLSKENHVESKKIFQNNQIIYFGLHSDEKAIKEAFVKFNLKFLRNKCQMLDDFTDISNISNRNFVYKVFIINCKI